MPKLPNNDGSVSIPNDWYKTAGMGNMNENKFVDMAKPQSSIFSYTTNVNSANLLTNYVPPLMAAAAAGEKIFPPLQSSFMNNYDSFLDNDDYYEDDYEEQPEYYQPSSNFLQNISYTQASGNNFKSKQQYYHEQKNQKLINNNFNIGINSFSKKQQIFPNQYQTFSNNKNLFSNQLTTKKLLEQKPNLFSGDIFQNKDSSKMNISLTQNQKINQLKLQNENNNEVFLSKCLKDKEKKLKQQKQEQYSSQESYNPYKSYFSSKSSDNDSQNSQNSSENSSKQKQKDEDSSKQDINIENVDQPKDQEKKIKQKKSEIDKPKTSQNIFLTNNNPKSNYKPISNIFVKKLDNQNNSIVSINPFYNPFSNAKKQNNNIFNQKNLIDLQQKPISVISHQIPYFQNKKQENQNNISSKSSQTVKIQKLTETNKKQEQVTALKQRVKQLEQLNKQYLSIIENLTLTVKNLSVVQTITTIKPQEKKQVKKNKDFEKSQPKGWDLASNNKKRNLFDDSDED